MVDHPACIVLSTFPNQALAVAVTKELLQARLIACGNLLPGVQSLYMWQGELCDETEVLLIAKTTQAQAQAACERIRQLHTYQTPELLVLPTSAGDASYLAWLTQQVGQPAS